MLGYPTYVVNGGGWPRQTKGVAMGETATCFGRWSMDWPLTHKFGRYWLLEHGFGHWSMSLVFIDRWSISLAVDA